MVGAPSDASVRLEARLDPETKALAQRAAQMEGRTLTDFVITALRAAATETIERHQLLQLSLEDSEAFADALLAPPAPDEALRAAAARYKKGSLSI